jgi:hypothetical protein
MSPYNLDDAIQKVLRSALPTTVPVYKAEFVASPDLKVTDLGYVYWNIDQITADHHSEGLSGTNGEVVSFTLDVAVAAHQNTQRKSLANSVLNVLQPVSGGRRKQLTAYLVPGTSVRINYLRLLMTEEVPSLKTGLSTPDMTMLLITFSGKATC